MAGLRNSAAGKNASIASGLACFCPLVRTSPCWVLQCTLKRNRPPSCLPVVPLAALRCFPAPSNTRSAATNFRTATMPVYIAVQCAGCRTFQGIQQPKAKKWKCRMWCVSRRLHALGAGGAARAWRVVFRSGQKQSLVRVFASADKAKDGVWSRMNA